jgi:two-component system phosphate regulon sensor histidine kinase PhoR
MILSEDVGSLNGVGMLTQSVSEKSSSNDAGFIQTQYQAIADDETVMICRFDRSNCLTYVNRTLCQFLGMEKKQLLGKSIFDFMHPEDKLSTIDQLKALRPESVIGDSENRILSGKGEHRWIHWHNHLIPESINGRKEIQSVGQDVTYIHNILDLYSARAEFDRVMIRILGRISSYYHEDLDRIIDSVLAELGAELRADRAYLFSFDFAQESFSNTHEWCADNISSLRPVKQNLLFSDFPWWSAKIRNGENLLVTGFEELPEEASAEKAFLLDNGIHSMAAFPLQTKKESIGFLGFDLSGESRVWQEYAQILLVILGEAIANAIEGNKANQLIKLNEARERLFIDALPALIIRIDNEGRVLDHTVGCHGVLSQYVALHTSSEVKTLSDLFEKPIAEEIWRKINTSNVALKTKDQEFEITVAGQITTLEMKFSSVNPHENILVFQDISEKKNLEQLKTDFINNTTHEMRTPLTTIILMIDLIEKSSEQGKRDQYWQILKGEVNRERMLVEDLLTVSRIERGKYTATRKPIDICASLHEAITTIQPQADAAGIEIDTQMPIEELSITGDPQSCHIVFTNLLSNAVKFSPEHGNIEVKVTETGSEVQIEIMDHGIGISEEDQPRIFNRFFRGKNAISGAIQGSGIGLFIVDHLVRDMGGRITVESKIGGGTRFTITFPLLSSLTNI